MGTVAAQGAENSRRLGFRLGSVWPLPAWLSSGKRREGRRRAPVDHTAETAVDGARSSVEAARVHFRGFASIPLSCREIEEAWWKNWGFIGCLAGSGDPTDDPDLN
ncbi:hypothetical protein V6N11_066196 [Hibiscus sabdariffa]|uniref:Uncharacterized protein n=1 Tax=Hibiscus sabdariffa TaxID=183260 RepID=A0ABR1ZYV9_9ROSI